jgi:hypothetical protein
LLENPKVFLPHLKEQQGEYMDNQHTLIDSHELAWLAGCIECDGSILMGYHNRAKTGIKPKCGVTFCNTGEVIFNRVLTILKSLDITGYVRELKRHNRPHCKPVFQVELQNQSKCRKLLTAIYPYLLYKKPQADLVLEFIESRISRGARRGSRVPFNKRELQIVYSARVLNHKGVSQTEDHDLVAAIAAATQ